MSWAKLDDQIFAHPKIINLAQDSKLLYLAGLAYCAGQLTDGLLSPGAVRMIAAQVDADGAECAGELVTAGLWEVEGNGDYRVHDYLDYNPSGAQVQANHDWSEVATRLRPVVLERDRYTCQYCGATEDLTLDHIMPRSRGGDSSLSNLRTACRSCNSAKGARTPEEWQR